MCIAKIEEIEEIGPEYAKKLMEVGIKTTDDLLNVGGTRKELAEKTGISEKLIFEWVNLADLFRIKGISEEYSDCLKRLEWTRLLNCQKEARKTSMPKY